MEIYLLEQDLNNGYDTYDSVIVIAENEQEARKIHPFKFITHIKDGKWIAKWNLSPEEDDEDNEYEKNSGDWVDVSQIHQIKVTHVGTALDNQKKGVLLASFNAG